jgi:hypothetical protein
MAQLVREEDELVKASNNGDRPLYQPWYERDFWTMRVRHLKPIERLMYRSILQGAWLLDPVGRIPNDRKTLMALADCPDEKTWDEHGANVISMFEMSKNSRFIASKRQIQEFRKFSEKHQSYVERGRAGGKANKRKEFREKPKEAEIETAEAQLEPSRTNTSKVKVSKVKKEKQEKENRVNGCADFSLPELAQKVCAEIGIRTQGRERLIVVVSSALESKAIQPGWTIEKAFEHFVESGSAFRLWAVGHPVTKSWENWFGDGDYDKRIDVWRANGLQSGASELHPDTIEDNRRIAEEIRRSKELQKVH